MEYKDCIPQGAFLVKPSMEKIDLAYFDRYITYFETQKVFKYSGSYEYEKYTLFGYSTASTVPNVVSSSYNFLSLNKPYKKGDIVQCLGVFKALRDVPIGKTWNSLDENGLPYWAEIGQPIQYAMFDSSASTSCKPGTNGIMIQFNLTSLPNYPDNVTISWEKRDHISIMGIKGTGKKRAYVRCISENIRHSAFGMSDETKIKAQIEKATLGEFEVDMTYRDRLSFRPPIDSKRLYSLLSSDNTFSPKKYIGNIMCEVFIETIPTEAFRKGYIVFPNNIGEATKDISVDFAIIGKYYPLGLTLTGVETGRVVERRTETNFLQRRTIKKATETFRGEILLKSVDDYLKADHFFRIASETSHIIHAGIPNFDWKFIYGVVDGNMPVFQNSVNKVTINGTGVAFFATDPLKTQKDSKGWK